MKLAIMGDFHYPCMQNKAELHTVRDQFFGGLLEEFLDVDADYHISIGDFTNEGRADELQFVYKAIHNHSANRRFVHVLGNHDTVSLPKHEILGITGQQRFSAIDTEDAILVFLDTTKEMNMEDFGGEIDEEQMVWLKKLIQQSGEKTMIVFGHHPLDGTTQLSDKPMHAIHPEFDMWSVLSAKRGIGAYICGHNHINSIVQKEQWCFIQTAACLDILGFRMIELNEGKLSISMIDLMNPQRLEAAVSIVDVMGYFRPTQYAAGEESDRNWESMV
ncbi:Calcineurin-like phosphoesterase [Paenibacillus sp. 1_12]|uniref:metallophosphoesterase family protein n=1 Tax=Paenibacillus sp. 1_12 TaxID=1566278 RepID=UPI0008F4111D|nr:metallophosphoesterase [Paenibacillus sp. 1_12]SFK80750.1 Calcineurin-like phosphoesterase [Paenibacillus sp. 1_12]